MAHAPCTEYPLNSGRNVPQCQGVALPDLWHRNPSASKKPRFIPMIFAFLTEAHAFQGINRATISVWSVLTEVTGLWHPIMLF